MADELQIIDGIPIRSEQIGFSADQLIACGKCAKANPPNRLNCFYCGEALEVTPEIAAGIRFTPSEIEDWEQGVSVVVTDWLSGGDPQAIASAISIESELVASLVMIEPPLPLFRIRPEEADEVASRLSRLGLMVECVEDSSLALGKPPIRLKGIAFGNDSWALHSFNSSDRNVVEISEIVLFVVGSLVTTTVESKLKRKRKEIEEFDEHLASSDHAVIDVYTSTDEIGFRILPHGFDFSCLGKRKSLVAGENIRNLLETLHELAPKAAFDRSYSTKSAILDCVWPRTVANTSKGIERNWFGVQRGVGSITSNEAQFTRYSRTRRKLL
ncbi:MAG: hypothetical protein ABIR33_16745 [Pyrinomonadaceae bacterium]